MVPDRAWVLDMTAPFDVPPESPPFMTGGDSGSRSDTFTFTPTPGSNCAALLTVYGGYFDQLPCTAHFTVVGQHVE